MNRKACMSYGFRIYGWIYSFEYEKNEVHRN